MLPKSIFLYQMFAPTTGGNTDHRMIWTVRTMFYFQHEQQCPGDASTSLRVLDEHLKGRCLTSAVSFLV